MENPAKESSKIYADFTLSRIKPEIKATLTQEQLIELRRALIAQSESSHHTIDLRFTVQFFFQKYYFVILGGKDRRRKTLANNNARKEKAIEKILTVVLSISLVVGFLYSMYYLFVLLYEVKKEMGIDLFPHLHLEDVIRKFVEMIT